MPTALSGRPTWMLLAGVLVLLALSLPAHALTAVSADVDAGANCTSTADLNLSWSAAGTHDEFGVATDRTGAIIGTFGPSTSSNNTYSGTYQIPITTAQPSGSLIGSYAWIGANPPAQSTAVEFFVLYNCTTRAVILRCLGAYGTCPRTAAAALASLPRPAIPASSAEMLAVLITLLMIAGGLTLRRRSFPLLTRPPGS